MKGFPENKCFPTGLNLGLPRQGFFSFHWTTEAIFLLISSYPSLLISSYSSFLIFKSVSCITDIHINFYKYLYFNFWKILVWGKRFLFLSWQNIYSSFWGVFWGGQAFFHPFGVKVNVYTGAIMLFFASYLFLFFSSYLFLFFLFLHILIFLYLNFLFYYRHAY